MKVCILGGAGFLGTAILEAFARRGWRVIVADTSERIRKSSHRLAGAQLRVLPYPKVEGLDRMLEGSDILIHLASTSSPSSSMGSVLADVQDNVLSSIKVFEAAKGAGVSKIIFASSGGTVYGNVDISPVNELHPCRPISAYGASKAAVENYLRLYSTHTGMKTISLRIGNPYGPYQLSGTRVGVIARYLKAAYLGSTIEVWGDGTAVRDYIYIDDLVSAVVAASEARTIKSGEYNIGSGQGHSINDIIYLVGSVTKKDLEVKYTSARSFDVPRMVLNCELFSAATGWSVDVPLAEGIQHLWRVITETVK